MVLSSTVPRSTRSRGLTGTPFFDATLSFCRPHPIHVRRGGIEAFQELMGHGRAHLDR